MVSLVFDVRRCISLTASERAVAMGEGTDVAVATQPPQGGKAQAKKERQENGQEGMNGDHQPQSPQQQSESGALPRRERRKKKPRDGGAADRQQEQDGAADAAGETKPATTNTVRRTRREGRGERLSETDVRVWKVVVGPVSVSGCMELEPFSGWLAISLCY